MWGGIRFGLNKGVLLYQGRAGQEARTVSGALKVEWKQKYSL